MKKTLKITLLVLLVVCIALTAFACNKKKDEKGLFDAEGYKDEAATVYTSATKVEGLEDFAIADTEANLVKLSKIVDGQTVQKILNINTKTVVATFTNSTSETLTTTYSVSLESIEFANVEDEVGYFLVKKTADPTEGDTTYTYYLYDGAGAEKASVTKKTNVTFDTVSTDKADIIAFNYDLYRMGLDGSITLLKDGNELTYGTPDIDAKLGENYFVMTMAGDFVIYDSDFNVIYWVDIPVLAQELNYVPAGEDSLFVQYVIPKFDVDEAYDIIHNFGAGMKKYDLYQIIINVKDGSESEVDLGYYVADSEIRDVNDQYFNGLNNDVKVIVEAYEIKDAMIARKPKFFVFNDEGALADQITFKLGEEGREIVIANLNAIEILNSDRILATDSISGNRYLFDYSGKYIGELRDYEFNSSHYIATATAIYDFDLNKVYDIEANEYVLVGVIGDRIALGKLDDPMTMAGHYYLYDGDNSKTFNFVATDWVDSAPDLSYAVMVQSATYTMYNANFDVINGMSGLAAQPAFEYDTSDKALFSIIIDGHTNYYIVA